MIRYAPSPWWKIEVPAPKGPPPLRPWRFRDDGPWLHLGDVVDESEAIRLNAIADAFWKQVDEASKERKAALASGLPIEGW